MTFPKARLVVSACLFLGWISFLFYLVVESPTIIVSRPQFLLASLWVVADVREDQGHAASLVALDEILWSADPADKEPKGQLITIDGLTHYGHQQGFVGAGKYLIPLVKETTGATTEYIVAEIPRAHYYPHLPPTLGTVELLKSGENPVPVVQAMSRFGAWKKENAEAALAKFEKNHLTHLLVARRLSLQDAYLMKEALTKAGAQAAVREETVKIYPLTPQTRAQVEEIIPSNP